jgi:15-cis-phytoene synthase
MTPLDVAPEDLAHCTALMRAGSKTFSTASRLFPRGVRDRATILYAFCRVSDDRVDDDPFASQRTIDTLRARLDHAYAGRPENDPVDRALAALLESSAIPPALPHALLEGMEWDLTKRRYQTLEEVHAYAARVAGTVGAMMTLVMGARGSEVLARACDLGVAMQLTNVARDVGEDAARGRIYLPDVWMRREGLDPDAWLRRPEPSEALAAVVKRLLEHADMLYWRADHGVALLPRSCRLAIRAARLIYADIGTSIAAAGFDSVTRRAVVPKWRKLWLLVRALGAPWESPVPLGEPPLEATRALVAACAGP